MRRLPPIGALVMTAATVRQVFVLSAIVRSGRFLRTRTGPLPRGGPCPAPNFFIVIPVLREVGLLRDAVAHFGAVARGHSATVVVATTAREAAEAHRYPAAADTVGVAAELAREGKCVHLHYPDPLGVKGDQLNYAVAACAGMLPAGMPASQAFAVCYDADSRPPVDSLDWFAAAIASNPAADVFHQSSRFELRLQSLVPKRLCAVVCDAGALRANRFVLGFEIPRLLNRSPQASAVKRALCAGVYAHVTGHGLCVRLSLLQRLPFPARSPLEDMHYSFILGSRGLPMVPVPSLDAAEVPSSVTAQFQQAARWFFGPARVARYLADPATRPGRRATLMAASALGSAAEWIGCAVVPPVACVLIATGSRSIRTAAALFVTVCTVQVVLVERWLGAPGWPGDRLLRVICFPLACAVHGVGGAAGAIRLMTGASGVGKTERSTQA
jgi:Glycosyl transferase family group 2